MNILETNNLEVCINSKCIVSKNSISLKDSNFYGLIGPNGGWKTTFIKAVLGVIKYSRSVKLFNKNIKSFNNWNYISYIPQNIFGSGAMFPITVDEFIRLKSSSLKNIFKRSKSYEGDEYSNQLKQFGIYDIRSKC